jgi:DNA-binding response OmpR family regulator
VIDVASAEEALEYLKGGGLCDFVVSDVMMPGMQGDELCRIIKSNKETSWLPVILLTAKTGRDSIIEGLEVGADDFITKPFDTELLRTKIDSILANRLRLSQYYLSRSIEMVKDSSAEGEPEESLVVEQEEEQISKVLDVDDQEFIDKATRIVLDNLSDADFNIDQLCAEMAMSRTLFYGRLKSLTSQAPQEFIRLIKLERAAILLKQGNSVLDVSVRTGFVNVKYFSTLFKKHFGVSPSKCK